jgi:hypothetical protein
MAMFLEMSPVVIGKLSHALDELKKLKSPGKRSVRPAAMPA